MALPANISTVTVFGRYIDFTGSPMQGTVTFTPSQKYVTDPSADVLIFSAPLVANLDDTGAFSIEIPATDDPDVIPDGFTWAVTEAFNRKAGRTPFSISVPMDTPDPGIDLVTVAPVLPADNVSYIVTSIDGMTGTVSLVGKYAPLDEDGKIPIENIPPITGGVTSVNGASGIVSLGASDVGALPLTGGTMQGPLNLSEDPTDPPQAATKAYVDNVSRRFDVLTYGATADGTTNDAAAFQTAIDAASAAGGGVVLVPQGIYKIATPLVMKTRVTLQGVGKGVSVLSAPANDLITFTANAFWWSIQDLTLKVLGGGHVLNGSHNLSAFTISRCSLQQLGAGYSIWYQHSGQIVEAYVSFCDLYVDGDPRTVPAFDWSDPAGGFNANVIEKCVATVNGDDSQYFFKVLGTNTTSDYTYNNAFRDIVFETCSGGGIYATSQFGLVIDNCWMWDDPVGGIKAAPFFVGKETSGLGSRCTVIRNSGRIGDHMAAGVKDLVLDGSCQQTTIDSFRCVPDNGKVDLGNSSYVQFVNKSPGTVITGTADYMAYAAEGDTHNGIALDGRVTGDAQPRMRLKVDGSLLAGSGASAPDVSLYRGDVGLWQTDESLAVGGHLSVGGQRVVPLTWLNVKLYGAVGNGVADDTEAIQDAINDANSAGGGVVYIPRGTYKLTSALVLKSHVQIRGDGINATVLQQTSSSSHGISGSNLELVSIEDLLVDGPGSGTGRGIYLGGTVVIYSFYVTMRNVMVRQFGDTGIFIDDPVTTDLYNVTSKENGGQGFFITCSDGGTAGTSTSLVSCYAHNNVGNGFRLWNMVYSTFTGCAADHNVNGYKIESCESVTLTGCGAEQNTGDSIQVSDGNCISVFGGWLNESGTNAVHIQDGAQMVLLMGIKEFSSVAAPTFIKVDTGCTAVVAACKSDSRASNFAPGTTTVLSDTLLSMSLGGKLGVGTTADSNAMVSIAQPNDQRSVVISNTVSGGNLNQPSIDVTATAAAGLLLGGRVAGDTTARVLLDMTGKLSLGPGNATRDTNLYRGAANRLQTDDTFRIGSAATLEFGTAGDVNLYRASADVLGTDDALNVTGYVNAFSGLAVTGVDVSNVQPGDMGYKAWVCDPATVAGGGTALTNGTVYLSGVYVRRTTTVSQVTVATANVVTPTAAQCWLGLYNSSGTLLTSVDVSGTIGAQGPHQYSLSSQTLAPGFYYVGFLSTSSPAIQLMSGITTGATKSIMNGNIATPAQLRFAVNATSQTTLPSSLTLSSNTATGSAALWAGLA
ncbi:glycosyl hydrolase family 28-related protein [Streptomyces sp. NPDC005506]|uniref:glycosyl hydrolase family 28-related protein n=1 Tax=Streptomyces sp. NPDC005506 TaxID=3364718 RepID=UPI003680AD47